MLQLMKRFGSFRGSKKKKERCKILERRHSDPQGLPATMEWRVAEALECCGVSLLNLKGNVFPSQSKTQGTSSIPYHGPSQTPGLGLSVDRVSSREIVFFLPNNGDVVTASMIIMCSASLTAGQLTLECLYAWLDLFQPGGDSGAITHTREYDKPQPQHDEGILSGGILYRNQN
ncbi:hypothetical protein DUI87_17914 [Hirundo rustica rustica]|uniref:Uncharacterized protein n=1 Tax=Hirundo rustica rustica TaxID=333673 RepID=A0A3M0JUN1_HIRRU|nr:hypothetical protein DUI87_17914 [Hirundo rustica rustica]